VRQQARTVAIERACNTRILGPGRQACAVYFDGKTWLVGVIDRSPVQSKDVLWRCVLQIISGPREALDVEES